MYSCLGYTKLNEIETLEVLNNLLKPSGIILIENTMHKDIEDKILNLVQQHNSFKLISKVYRYKSIGDNRFFYYIQKSNK